MLIYSALLFLMTVNAQSSEHISVRNAWIRAAPPTAKVMAAYLEIVNNSDQPYTLMAAESNRFERIEFHLSQVKNNVSTMVRQHRIVIPGKTTFSLQPGQYHLMLFKPMAIQLGDTVPIKLTFQNGETLIFSTTVKAAYKPVRE